LLNVSAHGCTAAGLVTTALIRTSEPHTARWKLVHCRTVVIAWWASPAAGTAITVKASAAAISAWPDGAPPSRANHCDQGSRRATRSPPCVSAGRPDRQTEIEDPRGEVADEDLVGFGGRHRHMGD
jgi:hypothetical protein